MIDVIYKAGCVIILIGCVIRCLPHAREYGFLKCAQIVVKTAIFISVLSVFMVDRVVDKTGALIVLSLAAYTILNMVKTYAYRDRRKKVKHD